MTTSTVAFQRPGETCLADPTCINPVEVRGMCRPHYGVWYREHPELVNRKCLSSDPYWKVRESVVVNKRIGCWDWTRSLDSKGYARIWDKDKLLLAYKVAYLHDVGPIPEGLVLDHLCERRICCAPLHLEPVTQRINMHRGHNSVASRNALRKNPNCRCWDRYAPECPAHGQTHWVENWAELVAGTERARKFEAAA